MDIVKSISAEQTKEVAADITGRLYGGDVLCLYGDLGAGKTTFTQGLLAALDVPGPYPSPTFTIVNMYDRPTGEEVEEAKEVEEKHSTIKTIYHVDAYRITVDDLDDLGDIGWDMMIADKNAIIVLEWPERLGGAVPSDAKAIHFTTIDENIRELRCENF